MDEPPKTLYPFPLNMFQKSPKSDEKKLDINRTRIKRALKSKYNTPQFMQEYKGLDVLSRSPGRKGSYLDHLRKVEKKRYHSPIPTGVLSPERKRTFNIHRTFFAPANDVMGKFIESKQYDQFLGKKKIKQIPRTISTMPAASRSQIDLEDTSKPQIVVPVPFPELKEKKEIIFNEITIDTPSDTLGDMLFRLKQVSPQHYLD